MKVHRITDGSVVLEKDGAIGLNLITTSGCELVELTLAEGSSIPPHSMPIAVTFYVCEGSGTIDVDGDCADVKQGDVIAVEAGTQRSWSTKQETGVRLLVIKHVESYGSD